MAVEFSTVSGAYLFAMGIGSWLSRYIGRGLVARFLMIEPLFGLIGGFSSTILFLGFAYTDRFRLLIGTWITRPQLSRGSQADRAGIRHLLAHAAGKSPPVALRQR